MNSAEPEPLCVLEGVQHSFGGVRVLDLERVGLARASGITALIGPNGAGKTTLFDVMSGFVRPKQGQVRFEGHSLVGRAPNAISRYGLVRTFQLTRLFERLTVIENLLAGARPDKHHGLVRSVSRWGSTRRLEALAQERADQILSSYELTAHRDTLAGQLSGGQKKLVELARAMMTEPSLLLLDEPLAGVNPRLRQSLLAHIRRAAESGTSVLMIEHDLANVMATADRVLVLDHGRLIADGPANMVRDKPEVLAAYLGGAAS